MTPKKYRKEKDFYNVCEMLKVHDKIKGRPTPTYVLNALFAKHVRKHKRYLLPVPILSPDNVEISIKILPKMNIIGMIKNPGTRLPNPNFIHLPVVVVRYKGTDCLIDGGSRAGVWKQSNDFLGTHPAIILTVRK